MEMFLHFRCKQNKHRGDKMLKTEDGGFILDDSGMCPYSINEKPEKEKENKEEKDN